MIKNKKYLEEFENELIKMPSSFEKNLFIFNEMLELAKYFKKIPPPDPLEDIEIDIKYAKAINGIKRTT